MEENESKLEERIMDMFGQRKNIEMTIKAIRFILVHIRIVNCITFVNKKQF